jgi:ABC-type uncharacterized transport system involved in gliding motility auxiliary subunit
VQLALRQDIDRVENRLTLVNILAMPVLVGLFAILVALVRRTRTRRRFDAGRV